MKSVLRQIKKEADFISSEAVCLRFHRAKHDFINNISLKIKLFCVTIIKIGGVEIVLLLRYCHSFI